MKYIKVLMMVLCCNLMWTLSSYGQNDDTRKSEDEIKVEDVFVSAKRLATIGKKADAIKILDSLRRVSEPSAVLSFELAKLHYENKDYNQTESNLKTATRLDPDNYWIRSFDLKFAKEMGRNEAAIQILSHLLTLKPKLPENYDLLTQLYLSEKKYTNAISTLESKEKNIGWSVYNVIKKAEILDKAGKINESVSVLKTLCDKYPTEKKYYQLIVNVLQSNDKTAETEPYLNKILQIDPNDNEAKLGLVLINKGKGTSDEYFATLIPLISNPDAPIDIKIKELLPHVQKHAQSGDSILGSQLINICDKLVIAHPNEAKSHAIYGDVLKNNSNFTAAIRQYEKTLSLNNRTYAVWEQLMFCLLITENFNQLQLTSTDAMDYFPNQAMVYYFAAKSHIAKKELKKASDLIDEATMISAGNSDIDSRLYTLKAEMAVINKDWSSAKTAAEHALKLSNNKNQEAMELMGDIYKATSDLKNALIHWKKSFDLGNRNPRLLSKIESVKTN